MKFRALRYTLLLTAIFGIAFLLRAALPTVATGTWVAEGSMATARSGACTVVLSDGRLLISGGADANGPTATADLFSTTGSWSAAATMKSPRSYQSCAVLQDGRVLVAGGTSANGVITNAADLYDPGADSWTQAAFLNDSRSGATASVLQDGRVLIAGGHGSGGALNTLEIYDPTSGTFSNAGTMSAARQEHAAAVLSDGQVLIIGGSSDGTNALKTTEIYDPQTGLVSAGPAMSTARVRHTATTLLDGTVVVIGGTDYTNDVASAEVFDPVANTFSAASNLATARSKHSAFLLPNNSEVLVVGGQSAGSDLASAELYIPWQKAFQATGAMATPRSDATGAALTNLDGRLLIAGGSSANAELYGFATIKTDASDYPPGTTVTITGSGWQPNETVNLTLVESPLVDTHGPFSAVADAFGNISNSSFVTDAHDQSIRFYLTASGSQSQAQNTFTDAGSANVQFATAGLPNGVTVNVTATFTNNGGNLKTNQTISFTSPGPGGTQGTQPGSTFTYSFPSSLTVSGTTYNFSSGSPASGFTTGADKSTTTVTGTYAPACTAASVTTQPTSQTITYGQNATFTAAASGNPSPTVQWQVSTNRGITWANLSDGGVVSGSSSGTLTLTAPPVSLSTNQYRAVFTNTCGGTQTPTSNAATLTVNKITVTAAVTANNKVYDGSATATQNTCTLTGVLAGDVGNVTCSASTLAFTDKNTGAGRTVNVSGISLSGSASGNYQLSSTTTTTTASITARAITVTAAANTKSYDGTTSATATPTITSSTLASGDTANFTEAYASKNVGTGLTLNPSGTVNDGNSGNNYAVTLVNNTTGVITGRPITVTAATNTKTYDGTTSAVATPTITSGSVVTGDSANFTEVYSSKIAGNGLTLIPSGAVSDGNGGNNYAVTFVNNMTGTINPATVTPSITASDKIYDGTTTATLTSQTLSGAVSGDVVTLNVGAANFSNANAGSGKIVTATGLTLSGASAGNYQLSSTTAMTTANITPATPAVTVSAGTFTYDGMPHAASAVATGVGGVIVPGIFEFTYTPPGDTTVPVSAGNYTVSAAFSSGNPNYAGSVGGGAIKINQAQLTVTAADASRPYGQANPPFTGTVTGVAAGDGITATYASAAAATTSAGVYGPKDPNAIIPTLVDSNNKLSNYTVTSTNGTLTITAIPLLVIANDKTRAFGAADPTFDAQYFSFVGGDTAGSSLTGMLTCTPSNTNDTAGSYAIHCGGLSSNNYTLTFVDGTLTVTDPLATIAVNPGSPSVTYGGSTKFAAQGTFASSASRTLANASGAAYQLHDLAETRTGSADAEAQGKLYSMSGTVSGAVSDTVEVYDPTNDSWNAVIKLNNARTSARAASVAGKVYVIGGCSDIACSSLVSTPEVYDPSSNTWAGVSSNGFTPRSGMAVGVVGGKIYVAGGNDNTGNALNAVEIYDPGTDTWSSAASLKTNLGPASGGVVNGTFYVVGISGGKAEVEAFNGATWSTVNSGTQSLSDIGAAVLNNVIYVIDGANIHAYDPASNTWTDKTSLNTARLQPEPVTIGNLIYVAGDAASSASDANAVESFASDEAQWSSSDTTVSAIDQAGKASALKVGSATITATSIISPAISGSSTLTVSPANVTPVIAVSGKTYDGTTAAAVTSCTVSPVVATDDVACSVGSANFSDKNAGAGKTVTATGITLTGNSASNYMLLSNTATTAADISARPLTVVATGVNKVYDGATSATVTLSDNRVTGDVFTDSYASAIFPDKNVGNGKIVSVSGISISGTDAGNYTFNATATTAANITPRTLTVTATGVNKVYDGTTTATVTLSSDKLMGDYVNLGYASATFADKNVSNGKTVTVSGVSITGGADAGNYTLNGGSQIATTANITPRTLTVTATGMNKVYDGNTSATVTLSTDKLAGDYVNVGYTSATFSDKTVASGKTVTVSGVSIMGGVDAGNYTLNGVTQIATTANITPRPLTVTATGVNKQYDGTTAATVTFADNRVTGDLFTDSYASATFTDKSVGDSKTVNVIGISISGTDSVNYTFNPTAATTANITSRPLTVTATGMNKQYDGTTSATVTLADNRVTGDLFTDSYASATFTNKNVGNGKTVNVTGLSITGTDAGNYTFNPTAATTADITCRPLTVTAAGANKQYDGTTATTVTLADNRVTGDVFTDSYASAMFSDRNVGNGKAVSVSGISIIGTDAANYIFNTTTMTTANITARTLTVTAIGVNRVYDGTATATVTLSTDKLTGDYVNVSYTTATFADKNVANGLMVTVSGVSITGGTDAGNYTLNGVPQIATTANITPATLTLTVTGASGAYNALPYTAACSVATGLVNGDSVALTITYSSVTAPVIVGNYTATCTSSGNSNYQTATGQASITITPATTTTSLVSSGSPSNWMQVVTLTATVSASNTTPTGTVSFYNAAAGANCSSLATSTLLGKEPLSTTGSGQQASISTPSLPVGPGNTTGTDTILACYNSDSTDLNFFNPNFSSSSGTLTQTVNPAPIATLNPASLSFGNQQGGTTSGTQAVIVSNLTGTAALSVASITFTGTNPNYFTQTNNCTSVAIGGSCTVNVAFAPPLSATGVATADLVVTDNNENVNGSTQSSLITGAGTSSISSIGSLSTYAIFATANGCSSLNMSGNGTVDSFNSNPGPYSSSHLTSGGNVGTNGNVTLSGNPVVSGMVASPFAGTGNCSSKTMTGYSTSGGAKSAGQVVLLQSQIYPAPPVPNPAPLTTTQNISGSCGSIVGCSNNGSKNVILAAGSYGNVSVSGGTIVNVSGVGGGTYNFNSLTLSGNSTLVVTSNTGPVTINLAGKSISGGNVVLDLSGGVMSNASGLASNLQFYYAGFQPIKLSGGTGSYAVVYAPNAPINVSGGSHFYGAIVGSTVNSSGGTAIHYDANLPNIQAGDYIWFSSAALSVQGLPTSGSVKVYVTNASISYPPTPSQQCTVTLDPKGQCTLPVPNAVVTFSSTASTASTTWDATNFRWSTLVPTNGSTTVQAHTFLDGFAHQVPSGGFPTGIQNVTFSAAFSTSTTGISFNWQWGAAVYHSFTSNYSLLTVNPVEGSDPAGTPENYKSNLVFGATGPGYTGLYVGTAGVVPTIAEASVSPSSLDFTNGGTVTQMVGTSSGSMTAVLTNNQTGPLTISSIQMTGANPGDFIESDNCPISPLTLAGGGSCTLTATFRPTATGKRTAKIAVNDGANNSPQTVFLKGTGQQ